MIAHEILVHLEVHLHNHGLEFHEVKSLSLEKLGTFILYTARDGGTVLEILGSLVEGGKSQSIGVKTSSNLLGDCGAITVGEDKLVPGKDGSILLNLYLKVKEDSLVASDEHVNKRLALDQGGLATDETRQTVAYEAIKSRFINTLSACKC